jgi:hypothetical protein
VARLIALVLLAACGHQPLRAAAPTETPAWRTLRAEHRVALDVTLSSSKHDRRNLRGAIAVERPDRFRLRALGPGGITLFDILVVGGAVKVRESIRDPKASVLGEIVQALAGDLSAAFQLEPAPAARKVRREGDALIVEEPERTVRLTRFVGAKPVASRIDIENRARKYTVGVDASGFELDSPLDPALFSD